MFYVWTISLPVANRISLTLWTTRFLSLCVTMSPSRCMWKLMKYTTSRARRVPFTTSLTRYKRQKPACTGAINVLGLAKRTKARVLQASTSEVYGDPEVHPQTEDYWGRVNPIGTRACYDEGKRAAETLFFDYYRQHSVPIKVVRIFNTYGPRMLPNDGRVVSNFIVQALSGKDITIYGDGSQTRSFCYVDDLLRGMMAMMTSREDFTGPVNIGNPNEFTIKQLAEKVIAMTGSSSKLVYRELPQDDPRVRRPDISLAKKELDWEPSVQLEEGLDKTIKFFKELS
jgi:UDP-glucuronate decarboxylase